MSLDGVQVGVWLKVQVLNDLFGIYLLLNRSLLGSFQGTYFGMQGKARSEFHDSMITNVMGDRNDLRQYEKRP